MFSYVDTRDKTAVIAKRMKYFTNSGKKSLLLVCFPSKHYFRWNLIFRNIMLYKLEKLLYINIRCICKISIFFNKQIESHTALLMYGNMKLGFIRAGRLCLQQNHCWVFWLAFGQQSKWSSELHFAARAQSLAAVFQRRLIAILSGQLPAFLKDWLTGRGRNITMTGGKVLL